MNDPNHDIVPTLRMFDGVLMRQAADEIKRLRAKIDTSFSGGAAPSHYCNVCSAMWRQWDDGSWNLRSKQCGKCCDNELMGDQIVAMSMLPVALPAGPELTHAATILGYDVQGKPERRNVVWDSGMSIFSVAPHTKLYLYPVIANEVRNEVPNEH